MVKKGLVKIMTSANDGLPDVHLQKGGSKAFFILNMDSYGND